jgi:hypothetical protein
MALSFVCAASAQTAWFDDFDSYADQAALDAVYTQLYADPVNLDQTRGYSDGQSVSAGAHETSYDADRMWKNLGGEYEGTDANPLKFEFMIQMDDTTNWWARQYIEIRGYTGAGYGDGDLQELIAMGCTSSGVDTNLYAGRVVTGDNWFNLQTARSTEWTRLTALIKSTTVEMYVDGNLEYTSPRSPFTIDSVVVGSGLSSQVEIWFDDLNIEVIPEPASLSLLGLGGLALLRRRR